MSSKKKMSVILSDVKWTIDTVPKNAKNVKFDKVPFKCDVTIILPEHRYCDGSYRLSVKSSDTVKNVLTKIYNYYQERLTDVQVANIKEDSEMAYEYLDQEKYKTSGSNRLEIMGGLVFFEGLQKVGPDEYVLRMGS